MSRKLLGMALLSAGVAVAPVSVLAASYAISVNQISNFGMTFITGSGSLSGFTFSNSAAAINNTGTSGVNMTDAPASCLFCGFNNAFNAHSTGSGAFSYGDALIANTTITGGAGAASAIAESYIINGNGFATGSNKMTSISFSGVTAGSQIQFGFNANLIMNTWLTAGGQTAWADSTMRITLSNTSGTVFDWAPSTLNWLVGANDSHNVTGYFANSTGALAGGNYTLKIEMSQTANVSAVPVPAAAWLLGSGLVGLFGLVRRKSH